jgi:hypothetical protein
MQFKSNEIRTCGFKLGELSHETRSYVCLHTYGVANCVMLHLYLRHDFCNILFKTKRKSHIILRSGPAPPPPQSNILGAQLPTM